MLIKRELKDWIWEFDDNERRLTLWKKHGEASQPPLEPVLTLDEVRMFSLFRFLIRAAQRARVAETKRWRLKVREVKHGQH